MTTRMVIVVKVSREVIWHVMRDRMDSLVSYLPDIEEIESQSRESQGEGVLKVVNRWRSTTQSAAFNRVKSQTRGVRMDGQGGLA